MYFLEEHSGFQMNFELKVAYGLVQVNYFEMWTIAVGHPVEIAKLADELALLLWSLSTHL
jgi:hypothetical protein